jgi:hypothetical protein
MCIECHVGTDETKGGYKTLAKEVNHDLIAAGHPRLNFEFAAYHRFYHKHWTDKVLKEKHPDFTARLWLVGQLVTSKAAIDLLTVRAKTSDSEKSPRPWPELAEYACYACHKDLQVDSPTQKSDYYKTRHPGSFPFGTWYLTALPQLTGDPGFAAPRLRTEGDNIRKLMERPGPSARQVADEAAKASATLDDALKKLEGTTLTRDRIRALLLKYVDEGAAKATQLTWDEAAQLYLAVAALSEGLTEMGMPTLSTGTGRQHLLAIKDRLQKSFQEGYDSPKGYDPLKPPSLADQFKDLRKQLGN